MFSVYWRRIVRSCARFIGIWYVTEDMSPQEVVDEAVKKWDKPSVALAHLLQAATPGNNVLYASCMLWGRCHTSSFHDLSSPQILRRLLESLPEHQRADAFRLAANNDVTIAASLLCQLAPNVIPGLAPVALNIAPLWGTEPRHDDLALSFYQLLPAYGVPVDEAKWLFVQGLVPRGFYAQAEPILLDLAQRHTSPDFLWLLITVVQALQRPHQQLLETVRAFMEQMSSSDVRVNQSWNIIKALYEPMIDSGKADEQSSYLHTIHSLLMRVPEAYRASMLTFITSENEDHTAHILTSLSSQVLAGFEKLVNIIVQKWSDEPRSDDLAVHFYQSLPAYGIPQEKANWLLARAFVARREYDHAESLLQKLADIQPVPDIIWLLAKVYNVLQRPPQVLLETLLKFTRIAFDDARIGLAWRTIGDLYGEQLGDGMSAVKAYQRAADYGEHAPQLQGYLTGNWGTIPALRSHPDYVHPVMTVIDLEVDPHPETKPGERVFEVGAVRIKGKTALCEYQSFIRRPFRPAKMKTVDVLAQAPEPEQVAANLRTFIGESLVLGHNIQAFDAKELRGMGVPVQEERIVDTLTFARLLYPDSLRHNLALLCLAHHIDDQDGEWHTALPDAQACSRLFQALCSELIQRSEALLNGFRALVPPGSAFDRAVLQPRNLAANPQLPWSLDPAPSTVHVLVSSQGLPASVNMQKALSSNRDSLVELHDPEGAYISQLPVKKRSLVTVNAYTRIEAMIAQYPRKEDVYVLPDPQTTLCPHRTRILIENTSDSNYKLLLFCLYQASHNKDIRTLYPMRLPSDESGLLELRTDLMRGCCAADARAEHNQNCSAARAYSHACTTHTVLMATHEVLSHQNTPPLADLIVVDDIADMQMHLPEYIAEHINSEQVAHRTLTQAERKAWTRFHEEILAWAQSSIEQPGYHERIQLRNLAFHLINQDTQEPVEVLNHLAQSGSAGKQLADQLLALCTAARRTDKKSDNLNAYWIDLWFSDTGNAEKAVVEQWAIGGVSTHTPETFARLFWTPYTRHILCGSAISTRKNDVTFLQRMLGFPKTLPYFRDERPKSRVYVPSEKIISPSGYLRRSTWMKEVGAYLYTLQAQSPERSILVTLNNRSVTTAYARALKGVKKPHGDHQVVSSTLGWTISKITERLDDPVRRVFALVSPRVRRTYMHSEVDIEVTGPLQFLHQQDPLVAAQMRVFAHLYEKEGPFTAYVLPQMLLELKARLSTNAHQHIILDSRLYSRVYRDEVLALLEDIAIVEPPKNIQMNADETAKMVDSQAAFLDILVEELKKLGFNTSDSTISDSELLQALRAIWNKDDFRPFCVDHAQRQDSQKDDFRTSQDDDAQKQKKIPEKVSQKDIVRGVLEHRDQLLVAATGGGKSLCYQLPAILMADEAPPKVTLIFSPLISLMDNQIDELHNKGIFSAIALNSTLSTAQRQEHLRGLKRGEYSIVYIAPEQIRSSALRKALQEREIGFVAMDEAHCLSQWGHDFRTDYFAIKDWLKRIGGNNGQRDFPILALTATARKGYEGKQEQQRSDQASTIQDIIEKLNLKMKKEDAVITSPSRKALQFEVEQIIPAPQRCSCGAPIELKKGDVRCSQCKKVRHIVNSEIQQVVEKAKILRIVELLNDQSPDGLRQRWDQPMGKRQKGLIYCAYRSTTTHVAQEIQERIPGLRIATYTGDLKPDERDDVLDRFTHDDDNSLDIVVATNAFGMGIDVRRLGFVIHFDTPGTLEAYYQEAGRAGRDSLFSQEGKEARCILLYHESDLDKQRYLSRKNTITRIQVEDVYDALNEIRRDVGTTFEDETNGEYVEQEIICTEQEIATRAGISSDNVNMILYYLEYHTTLHGKAILARGETANGVLQLKFEQDYEQQSQSLPETSSSQPLLQLFLDSEEYGLNVDTVTAISLKELASSLGWKIPTVESEILNLVRRHIITYKCDGRIRWTKDAAYAQKTLGELKQHIKRLIEIVDAEQAKRKKSVVQRFSQGETAYEDLNVLISKYRLVAVAPHILLRFLSALSHSDSENNELRLFKRFTRNARYGQPGKFEMQLWTENHVDPLARLNTIFATFQEVITLLERQHISDTGQELDLLKLERNFYQRQMLHQKLLLLDMLGLLKYTSDPSMGLALHITFKQPYDPKRELIIDLSTLHLKETYEKNKLKLMKQYATETEKDKHAEVFTTYFYGQKPLIEEIEQPLRTDLTQEQQTLLMLERGNHLIEGPAGCGKTTTLVEFIKHLVHYRHIPIDRIMVTAHYNSAINRITKELETLQEDESVAFSTTINSFGEKIFRKYRTLLERGDGKPHYENEPEIRSSQKTERQNLLLVSKALSNIFAGKRLQEPWPNGLERPSITGKYQQNDGQERFFLKTFQLLCEQGIFPTKSVTRELLESVLGKRKEAEYSLPLLYAVYMVYYQLKGEANYYDFEDQILFGLTILRNNPAIVREYHNHYEHIIVDELQDFTPAQVELLLIICNMQRNVLAFGDRDQAIRPKNTESPPVFVRLANADTCGQAHQLTTNFRSTQQILDLISAVRNIDESTKRQGLLSAKKTKGELPVVVNVPSLYHLFINPVKMVQVALDYMQQIPEQERGSVAFITAKSEWSQPVIEYLRSKKYEFSVLQRQSLYQFHHVDRVLVYFRLIADRRQDVDTERILRYCLVPYFSEHQIKQLKNLAKKNKRSILTLLRIEKVLDYLKVTPAQKANLQMHLEVLLTFRLDSRATDVLAKIREIEHGPFAVVADDEQKQIEINSAIAEFSTMTVAQVVTHIKRNITFLENEQKHTGLVVTSVDHAKSEEFDTVFYLGADYISHPEYSQAFTSYKRRFYVSISRAKKRLFLIVDNEGWHNSRLQSYLPKTLYREEVWSPGAEMDDMLPF